VTGHGEPLFLTLSPYTERGDLMKGWGIDKNPLRLSFDLAQDKLFTKGRELILAHLFWWRQVLRQAQDKGWGKTKNPTLRCFVASLLQHDGYSSNIFREMDVKRHFSITSQAGGLVQTPPAEYY
jgi:hypothetical protein